METSAPAGLATVWPMTEQHAQVEVNDVDMKSGFNLA